ncbi:MAG: hypothetical protein EOP38_24285 [Rubrivivax sp.]|nr:MAG: hypothetical protein EOP38_24285 [Rubrivivax sp.]
MTHLKLKGGPQYCQLWTLDRLRDERCVEEGNCWIWTGCMGGPEKTTPSMQFRGKVMPAYVATWLLAKGAEQVPKGLTLWRGCLQLRCINPACLKSGTAAKKREFLTNHGVYKCTPARRAAITKTARQKLTKLVGGLAEARVIRDSDDTQRVLAARHGISVSRVSRIQRNLAWTESVSAASIFNLGAQAQLTK